MLRKLAIAIAALALPLAAAAPVSAEINLHNGYIVVTNHVKVLERDGSPVKYQYVLTVVLRHSLGTQEIGKVAQGSHTVMNNCCVVAGSPYSFEVIDTSAYINHGDLRPRLCNIRGIPFGFAAVDITGTIQRDNANHWVYTDMRAKEVDTGCPSG